MGHLACALAAGIVLGGAAPLRAGENWSEPVFTLKRVCEPKQKGALYDRVVRGGKEVAIGWLGPQPGDNNHPSSEFQWKNKTTFRVELEVDAPGSFSAGGGAIVACAGRVTVSAPPEPEQKPGRKVKFTLSLYSNDLDSAEIEILPGRTVTRTLKGGVRFAPHEWEPSPKRSNSLWPQWHYAEIPFGRLVSQETTRHAAENLGRLTFGAHSLKENRGVDSLEDTFEIKGDYTVNYLSASLFVLYQGDSYYHPGHAAAAAPPPAPAATPPHAPLPPPAVPKAPPRPAGPTQSEKAEEMRRLFDLYGKVRSMEKRIAEAGVELGLQAKAISDIRNRIKLLEDAASDDRLTDDARATARDKAQELRGQSADLLAAQDKLVEKIALEYKELSLLARHDSEKAASEDALKRKFKAVSDSLEEQSELVRLRLYLSADRRDKFDESARELIDRGSYKDVVYRFRAVEYLRHNEPGPALYSLRKSLALNPDDPAGQAMLREVETGYLRTIAAKATGEAAEVREKLDEALMGKGEAGWMNYVKDVLTTGVRTSINAIGGKIDALTDLAVSEMDQAAVEHAGLQILIRLRGKGLSWEKIKGLGAEEFLAALRSLADKQGGPGSAMDGATALRMRLSVSMAMKNPDVQRLMSPSKEQFDADRGISYASTDVFELRWMDHAGDAINVANVASLLPGASIGKAGKLLGASEATQALTVGQLAAKGMRLEQLVAAMEKTRIGKAALEELMRFHENTGMVSQMIAQVLLDQGILEAGSAIGGEPGKLAAQALTMLGATSLDNAVGLLKNRRRAAEEVETLLARARDARQALAESRVPLEETAREVEKAAAAAESGAIPRELKAELEEEAERLQRKMAATQSRPGSAPSDETLALERHKQGVLYDAVHDVKNGETGRAGAEVRYARSLEEEVAQEAKNADAAVESLDNISKKLKRNKPSTSDPIVELPSESAAGSNAGSAGPQARLPGGTGANESSARRPNVTKANKVDIKDGDLADRELTRELGRAAKGADEAFFERRYAQARRQYALLLETEEMSAKTRQSLAARMRLIEEMERTQAEQAAQAAALKHSGLKENAAENIDPDTLKHIRSLKQSDLRPPEGAESAAKPLVIPEPPSMGGKPSRRKLALFKSELIEKDGKMVKTGVEGEILASKLGKKLKEKGAAIEVPAVSRAAIQGEDGPVEGIAIRYANDTTKIENASMADMLHAKEQIAQSKAFSAFIGDYDRHAGNYLLTQDGRVISIDHGLAQLTERESGFRFEGQSPEEAEKSVVAAMDRWASLPGARDAKIGVIDHYMHFEDMEPMIKKIEGLSKTELEEIVDAAYAGGKATLREKQLALENLLIRQRHLRSTLQARFPSMKESVPLAVPANAH